MIHTESGRHVLSNFIGPNYDDRTEYWSLYLDGTVVHGPGSLDQSKNFWVPKNWVLM